MPDDLPIEAALPALKRALANPGRAVLQAAPGAGKTTRVPLALLDEPWLKGRKIVMLEPRRIAARAAARRMASTLNQRVGETVGYRVRHDAKVGPRTRIEIVTDGLFVRLIQADPGLDGVGLLIFDEFHERGLDGDLGLAFALDAAAALRDDLRILAMSATLDGAAVARLLGDAPVVASEGRAFPVETIHIDRPPGQRIEDAAAAAVRRALAETRGGILVFLPGTGEIRRTAERLDGVDAAILPLYGDLSAEDQDRAIAPAPVGTRKVVLATSIAETSLTIPDIAVVVDGGAARVPRFDPRTGMTKLETVRVSLASADQRRGRAGRTGPGVCYRLWSKESERALAPFSRPEILEADLAPLALDLALWGVAEPAPLAWLDPPPQAAFAQATDLLRRLGALDDAGRVSDHGRAMAAFGLPPRLSHMLLRARDMGLGPLACDIAALIEERDILKGEAARDPDIRHRVESLKSGRDGGSLGAVRRAAAQHRTRLKVAGSATGIDGAGKLVALAYPDRIAQRREGEAARYRLSGGGGAFLDDVQALGREPYLAVADLDGDRREARVYRAAPVALSEIESLFADRIQSVEEIVWDPAARAVAARRRRCLGELILDEGGIAEPDPERVRLALLDGIRSIGSAAFAWPPDVQNLRARITFLRRHDPAWPDLSDEALFADLESWIGPYLGGMTRLAQLQRVDLRETLFGPLDHTARRRLDDLAPTHVTAPSGSRIPVDYSGEVPALAVRLQEMFGAKSTPAILGGRVPLLLHLLSPAGRPVQTTRDLGGFWAGSYRDVRSDLRGRYPKHDWPEDPLAARPTARAKRRGT